MKRYILSIVLSIAVVLGVTAQIDRSKRPEPGPAPTIKIGDFKSFKTKNGITVIVVENRKVPVVSFSLRLDIDPVFEGDAKGYVDFAGALMREGTTNRSKKQIDETIDFIGGSLSTQSSGIFASSLTRHKETLLDLMADVLLNPVFPEDELTKRINQSKSALQMNKTDANAIARNIATTQVYGTEHPYGEVVTEETLDNITVNHLKQYYNTYFKPNVAYMVIVGDIDVKEAKKIINKYFGKWKTGQVPRHSYATPTAPAARRVAFGDRIGASQSVTSVTYPLNLTPGHADEIKVSVMNNIFGGTLFSARLLQNIREDKGYTYGAYSRLGSDPLVARLSTSAEVRNDVTAATITEKFFEMNRMRNEPVSEETLNLIKNNMNGSFARSLESPRTIANFAFNIMRYNLPKDYYATYLERLAAVTVEDVQAMAQKYLLPENAIVVVAGHKGEVAESLKQFSASGEVEFFDAFGRPVSEEAIKPVPRGVTLSTVLNKYFDAIGGKENLMAIQDMETRMRTNMMGMEILMSMYQKAPNLLRVETAMGGNIMSVQVFDGTKAVVSQMGQKMQFTEGPQFEAMKMQAILNAEINYEKYGITKELVGIEVVDGQNAYRVEVKSPSGQQTTEFYSVETGLKSRTDSSMGYSKFSDYRAVGNLKFPFQLEQQAGPQKMDVEITEIKINKGIENSLFEL
jgi:zinc protease